MFLAPISLQKISLLRNPGESLSLGELATFEEAQAYLEEDSFAGHELWTSTRGALQLQMFFKEGKNPQGFSVKISEADPGGDLSFHCERCETTMETEKTCVHQWGSYILMWQALTSDVASMLDTRQKKLAQELEEPLHTSQARASQARFSFAQNTVLESVSLFLEDHPLLQGESLSALTASDLSKYKLQEMTKDLEVPSPLLWNMPEVFRKKVTAYSGSYLHEVTEQNRLTTLLRYNFSDGTQVSAKDILRHPLQRAVEKDLLPQASSQTSAFSHWPLTQQREHLFLSQNLREIETIMQVLLGHVATQAGQGKLKVFLQTKNSLRQALQIHRVEFDPGTELSWRVEFIEKNELEAEFKLMSSRKKPFFFFESFAVEPSEGILIAHPWLREFQQLRELLTKSSDSYQDLISLSTEGRPTVNVFGEMELKSALKYLRTRAIPVRIIGDSVTLGPEQSQTQIHLDEAGGFYVLHEARINGQKNLARKGWTPRSALFLKTLSE
ncbi:MAG: hypothetical protein HUU57_10860, partial [Bdellovibrio sp.]|nr:hypothetical protein [Bdellovibrio sp.]